MEPRIQYAKTEDGVSIAYATEGEGTPLDRIPGWLSHLEMEWNYPTVLAKASYMKRLRNRSRVRL